MPIMINQHFIEAWNPVDWNELHIIIIIIQSNKDQFQILLWNFYILDISRLQADSFTSTLYYFKCMLFWNTTPKRLNSIEDGSNKRKFEKKSQTIMTNIFERKLFITLFLENLGTRLREVEVLGCWLCFFRIFLVMINFWIKILILLAWIVLKI